MSTPAPRRDRDGPTRLGYCSAPPLTVEAGLGEQRCQALPDERVVVHGQKVPMGGVAIRPSRLSGRDSTGGDARSTRQRRALTSGPGPPCGAHHRAG